MQKVPYMVIIGAKEESAHALSVRGRDEGEIGRMTQDEFLSLLGEKNANIANLGG